MRKNLKSISGQRMEFTAKIVRYGKKKAFKGPDLNTILLENVTRTDTREIVTDHVWFTAGKSWQGLSPGASVTFYARVGNYEKGYKGCRDDVFDKPRSHDYKLERPTKIRIGEK